MNRFVIPLIIFLALASGAAQAKENADNRSVPTEHLQSLNNPDYHKIDAQKLERPFHIYVRLPENYDADDKKQYPVVYMLDGGLTFPLLASYYRLLSIAGEIDELILVGISYGSDDFRTGNLRSTDFTAPSPEREHYGGAQNFQSFLGDELVPFIEDKYRADPKRRILFGHSLGGQFVFYSAMTKPDLFWGHIASNPAFHRNLPYFMELDISDKKTKSRLFAATGSNDNPRFRTPARTLYQHVTTQEHLPWDFKTETLEGHTHLSSHPAAFRAGIAWLLD